MKKIQLLSLMLLLSSFVFAQNSTTITPGGTEINKATETYHTFSTGGVYRGYVGIYSNPTDVDFGTGGSTTGKLHLVIGAVPKLTIDNIGNVGIGTTTPESSYKLDVTGGGFIVRNTANTRSMYYNPNSSNSMVFTGGDASINTNATNSTVKLQVFSDTKLSIGTASTSTGKVEISHIASSGSPTLHLRSTGTSSSILRATSTAVGSEWDNHFLNSATAASNLVYWTNSVNSVTPLILTGLGDAIVERNTQVGGYTRLGNDVSHPSIRVKKLTSTTAAAQGSSVSIPHGISDPSKIISINVMVKYDGLSANAFVGNAYTATGGYQFDYQYDGANIIVTNKAANSASILNKAIKVVVTYEE